MSLFEIAKPSNRTHVNWTNILFLTLSPFAAVIAAVLYVQSYGLHWMDISLFAFFTVMTIFATGGVYHRHYAHRAYKIDNKIVEFFWLMWGAAALSVSALRWSRHHRIHHLKVDSDEDPYTIKKGPFYAHLSWMFYDTTLDQDFSPVKDLKKNKLVLFQHKYYFPLAIVLGFLVPTLLGALVDRAVGGFIFGGLLRIVVVHHGVFCVNSLCHMWGTRPYSEEHTGRDSFLLALFTFGEGYHNFHHTFGGDYRNGHRWYDWDPNKWGIALQAKLGWFSGLKRVPDEQILRARAETTMKRVQKALSEGNFPEQSRFEEKLQSAREQLYEAAARMEDARRQYRILKRQGEIRSRKLKKEWKNKLREIQYELKAAQANWAGVIFMIGNSQA